MTVYRKRLPQLDGGLFLTDGGMETTLIFHEGIDLPHFAAFDLLRTEDGAEALRRYYVPFIEAAAKNGLGFILDSPTWRANPDWGAKLGYSRDTLAAINRDGIALLATLRSEYGKHGFPMVVSGAIGPRGDGYVPGEVMSPAEAEAYHREQIAVFASTEADMVAAFTLTNANEAIGITRAAQSEGMPVAISFTLETDGALPTGQSLADAIGDVDAATRNGPAYYMINCAHPDHIEHALQERGLCLDRIKGLRANASRRSHAELNEAPDLDSGDPVELASEYRDLLRRFPQIVVIGGCCGTDSRHVSCIGSTCCKVAA
jgi:S-methylmethionine-dependent homocysteine/selenocysteine methylase